MGVSPRKLIWADGMLVASLLVACSSQLAARRSQMSGACLPTTGGRRLGRAHAVIAQEGQGDPESFAQFWVTSRQGNAAEEGGSVAWWHLVARVARVISYGSKGGANVCVGC